jgi:hypothetical protein
MPAIFPDIFRLKSVYTFWYDFLVLMNVNKWMSYECSDDGTYTPSSYIPN